VNFNSYEFIFLFLPLAVALFYLAPAVGRIFVLIFISLLFYSFFGTVPFCVMVLTIIWGWISGIVLAQSTSRLMVVVALLGPFSILFLFKYLQFAFDLTNASVATRNLFSFFLVNTLPAGVSFHTFQVTAYMLDVRARRIKPEINFARFTAFLSFFPVLIAGPILHYTDIRDRLIDIQHQTFARISVVKAFRYIAFGLFYKTVLADVLHGLKDKYIESAGGLDAAFSILAYTMVIYYDFWGYSLMAMGIALLFGVELPLNFAQPYLSPNPKQFWRRWHITLSYWLRDYVYVNLGGNKNYVRNILIVFAVCGLWHGAGTNFIVWDFTMRRLSSDTILRGNGGIDYLLPSQ
jgi:alginate O-acetyltransferase complex protein AlgI